MPQFDFSGTVQFSGYRSGQYVVVERLHGILNELAPVHRVIATSYEVQRTWELTEKTRIAPRLLHDLDKAFDYHCVAKRHIALDQQ